MILDKTADFKTLSATGDKETWTTVSGLLGVKVNVQPSSNEITALNEGVYGKTYTVFTTASGIKDGMKMTVSGIFVDGMSLNKELLVKSVGNWSFGFIPHFEIICIDEKA